MCSKTEEGVTTKKLEWNEVEFWKLSKNRRSLSFFLKLQGLRNENFQL